MDKDIFDSIVTGMNEILADQQGKMTLRRVDAPPAKPAPLTPQEIVRLRKRLNMSQALFARFLNVAPDTERAWEQGKRTPSGPSLKLLRLIEKNPEILQKA